MSVLLEDTVSTVRLFQWEIASGKKELASWVVVMNFEVTSYSSSWDLLSLVIFLAAYLLMSS